MAEVDSKNQKKKVILAASLLLLLAGLVVYNVRRIATIKAKQEQVRLQASPSAPSPAATPSDGKTASSATGTTLAALQERTKALKWGRDPFVLDLKGAEDLPALQLKVSGIIYDAERPEATYAIINEEVVRIGDSIGGIKVIDIQPEAVRFKKFNQEFTLHLYEETSP